MKLAAGFSLLGLGFLIGFAMGDTPVDQIEVGTIPSYHTLERVKLEFYKPADERAKSEGETCLYTKPAGRGTYTLAIHAGVRCVTILGEQHD